MTTPDVPAERGRGELHERLLAIIESRRMEPWTDKGRPCCVMCGSRWDGEHKAECWVPTLREAAALLAPQEAPAEGISLSAQLSQAAAWMRVWDECQRLGMDTYGAPSTRTGLDIVLDFIRGRAAPQEAREPDGWTDSASADALRTGRVGGIAAVRSSAGMQGPVPVYLGAPAPAEATERERVMNDALMKAEREIRSLDVDADARRLAALHQLVAWWDDTSWGSTRWIAELAAIVENCRAAAMAADTHTEGDDAE